MKKCKENFQKSLSDILMLFPEAGLQKMSSPADKKKINRNDQRQTKKKRTRVQNVTRRQCCSPKPLLVLQYKTSPKNGPVL